MQGILGKSVQKVAVEEIKLPGVCGESTLKIQIVLPEDAQEVKVQEWSAEMWVPGNLKVVTVSACSSFMRSGV